MFPIAVDDKIMESTYEDGNLCEYHMLDWIDRNVPKGGTWIDAGANVGNHTMPFSLWADKVVAFEPMPQNHALLQYNINQFGATNILAHRLGVGKGPSWTGATKGGTGENCQWILHTANQSESDIQVVAIDAIIPPKTEVRLLKLDVEGMELDALHGAHQVLLQSRPEIFVEIWDEEMLNQIEYTLALYNYELVERWNVAPTFHFSQRGRYKVTYKPAERLRPL